MNDYILVPVKKLKEWEAAINTIALQIAFDVADDIARYTSNKWIPTGGEKPELSDDTLVDVKFLGGHVVHGHGVSTWRWSQDGESHDIIHYRIHRSPMGVTSND